MTPVLNTTLLLHAPMAAGLCPDRFRRHPEFPVDIPANPSQGI